MRFVKSVRIENFRSIREMDLVDIDEYTPIVGVNSSGKSNIFRALNLFFNDVVTDMGDGIALERDYPDFLSGKKTKRRVSVSVTFDPSSGFEPRDTASLFTKHSIEGAYTVKREWEYADPVARIIQDSWFFGSDGEDPAPATPDELLAVQRIVRSVGFRYIPNHVQPAEMIRKEMQALRPALIGRLKQTNAYDATAVDLLMSALKDTADRMFQGTASSVGEGLGGMTVAANLPASFADLAFDVGLRSISDSGRVQAPELQGSGAQSFMLLHVLDLLDRASRGLGFGWLKAHLWAIEEPESFLHAGLRARYADDLRQLAMEADVEQPHNKRQVFATTHQDEFVRVGDNAVLVELEKGQSATRQLSARDAVQLSSTRAIISYRHPLMLYPNHPIVIVEGKQDLTYLTQAMKAAGLRPSWRLVEVSEVGGDDGGDDAIKYLRGSRNVLGSRPLTAPVIVFRDWEDTAKKNAIDKVLSIHPYSRCLVAPEGLCNPELGRSFKGIERYLPTAYVGEHVEEGVLTSPMGSQYPLELVTSDRGRKATYTTCKVVMAEKAAEADWHPGEFLIGLAEWLDTELRDAVGAISDEDYWG